MSTSASEPGPTRWRPGIDPERRMSRRGSSDRRLALRRWTVAAGLAAAGLNAVLFVQTGAGGLSPGAVQDAIVSIVNAVLPGAMLQPAAGNPTAAPSATPVATTGAS